MWADLILASISHYFKYDDREICGRLLRRLALLETSEEDQRLVDVFRANGYRYFLEGRSAAMTELRRHIRRCAEVDEPVLIMGESGVGKEHAARLVHERGERSTEPFVEVNCADFAGNIELASSALFGHRKGSFTGASADRDGRFVAADGGILYLDELGELPLEVQGKLLRVLQDGAIFPVGADRREREVDVRVIAATNSDLPAMIRSGAFRLDLWYRLSVLPVTIPPLHERGADIAHLAEHELRRMAAEGLPAYELTDQDRRALERYDWPGNVRQLFTVLKRSACLGSSVVVEIGREESMGVGRAPPPACGLPRTEQEIRPVEQVRNEYCRHAYRLCDRKNALAARRLGIAANTLRKYLKECENGDDQDDQGDQGDQGEESDCEDGDQAESPT